MNYRVYCFSSFPVPLGYRVRLADTGMVDNTVRYEVAESLNVTSHPNVPTFGFEHSSASAQRYTFPSSLAWKSDRIPTSLDEGKNQDGYVRSGFARKRFPGSGKQLVSWCFEPSQPQRITSGPKSKTEED